MKNVNLLGDDTSSKSPASVDKKSETERIGISEYGGSLRLATAPGADDAEADGKVTTTVVGFEEGAKVDGEV
jgi:hypothetical protein